MNSLNFGGSVGEHRVVGEIAVMTKSGKEWRPFDFNYSCWLTKRNGSCL